MGKRKKSPALSLAERKGFRSIFEHDVSKILTFKRIIWEYEPRDKVIPYEIEVKKKSVTCSVCGAHSVVESHSYLPDFYIPKYDLFIEAKGYFRQGVADRKKLEALSKAGVRIVVLFQSVNTKIRKGSNTTYGDWATKAGVKFLDIKDDLWVDKLKSIYK